MRTLAALLLVGAIVAAENPSDLAGGTPIPDGTHSVGFPAMAKQSISFRSEAAEAIFGSVSFPGGEASIGNATIDGTEGTGSGSASIQVDWMKTGNETRDEHMRSAEWLNAEEYPEVSFTDISMERVEPTVWRLTGTWTMHGVSKEISTLANVRLIPQFPRLGENIVRIKADFDIDITEYGVEHQAVGSPAVAQVWDLTVVLLGVPQ